MDREKVKSTAANEILIKKKAAFHYTKEILNENR